MTDNFSQLKQLHDEKDRLSREISIIDREIIPLQEKKRNLDRSMTNIDKQIHELGRKHLIISDHAILRLLERRFGQEDVIKKAVDGLRKELEDKDLPPTCKITIDDNLQAVINNNVLVTILEK